MIIAVDLSISPYFTVKDDNNNDDNTRSIFLYRRISLSRMIIIMMIIAGRSFYIAVFHCQR